MQIFKRSQRSGARKPANESAGRMERRPRILVIDENPTARTVIARRLSHLGYDVALAENGFAALGLLVARPVDIVLLDMGLTLLSAVATMEKIRASALSPHACFVTIAGRLERPLAVEALAAGADDHIAKPLDFDLLDARLRHLCVRAEQMGALTRHNAELDARIARRAVELGETREALNELQADRARLVSSIQALHDEIARLNAARG